MKNLKFNIGLIREKLFAFFKSNYPIILIFILALGLRIYVLQKIHDRYFLNIAWHGTAARSILLGRGTEIDYSFLSKLFQEQNKTDPKKIIDPEKFRNEKFDEEANLFHQATKDYYQKLKYYTANSGFIYLLALTWKIFGHWKYIYIQVIQIVLDALCVFLIYWLGKEIFNRKIGLIGAFLFAIFLPEIRLAAAAWRDIYTAYTGISATCLLVYSLKINSIRQKIVVNILLGMVIGLGAIFRSPLVLVLLPLFMLAIWIINKNKKDFLLSWFIPVASGFMIFLFFIMPHLGHLQEADLKGGDGLGHTFLAGIGQDGKNKLGITSNDSTVAEYLKLQGYSVDTMANYFLSADKESLKIIRENKLWYLKTIIKRMYKGLFRNKYNWNSWNLNPGRFLKLWYEPYFIWFAILGIWLSRDRIKKSIILLIVPIGMLLFYSLIIVVDRHIIPILWPFHIFAAVTICYLWQIIKKDKTSR